MQFCLGRAAARQLSSFATRCRQGDVCRSQDEVRQAGAVHCTRSFWSWFAHRPYSVVRPAEVLADNVVPDHIRRPEYAETSLPTKASRPMMQTSDDAVSRMRRACQLAKSVLARGGELCKAGVTTHEIDATLHSMVIQAGAYPSPLNYQKFPKAVCTSVNNVLCHGIPDSRPLVNGDVISIDITVYLDGVHGDTCATFPVGDIDDEAQHLIDIAKQCTERAVAACKAGASFNVIPSAISSVLSGTQFSVSPTISGHGVGEFFHAPPAIYHASTQPGVMEAGMTFTVEPIITAGFAVHRTLQDNWTLVTLDNSRAAQFEHTILITDTGADVLTA